VGNRLIYSDMKALFFSGSDFNMKIFRNQGLNRAYHCIEAEHKMSQFVIGRRLQLKIEISLLNLDDSFFKRKNRLEYPPGKQKSDQHGEQQRHNSQKQAEKLQLAPVLLNFAEWCQRQ
jgi:hypothetical protein